MGPDYYWISTDAQVMARIVTSPTVRMTTHDPVVSRGLWFGPDMTEPLAECEDDYPSEGSRFQVTSAYPNEPIPPLIVLKERGVLSCRLLSSQSTRSESRELGLPRFDGRCR